VSSVLESMLRARACQMRVISCLQFCEMRIIMCWHAYMVASTGSLSGSCSRESSQEPSRVGSQPREGSQPGSIRSSAEIFDQVCELLLCMCVCPPCRAQRSDSVEIDAQEVLGSCCRDAESTRADPHAQISEYSADLNPRSTQL
jgi:hypothetical protein